MSDPVQSLKEMEPLCEFFIGIDSDGCVFDTMEIKHKECFCPNFINTFGLQELSVYARESWEFVNLYSRTRGCNRFPAVIYALDLLNERPEVTARSVKVPRMNGLRDWMKNETRLGNPALKVELERGKDADLAMAYEWSTAVNESVGNLVRGVPPFPLVRESLMDMQGKADVIVVSQTPLMTICREWEEQGIDRYVRLIAAQEMGTKSEHLALAAKGKYPDDKILMIGDAPGDLEAAKKNGVLYYPINPGHEEASWRRFHEEALRRFFAGSYAGAYESALIEEFNACLPELPPWKV
jgi:phosphoglycolate phosphatase-like HAD superfamily hydrolase